MTTIGRGIQIGPGITIDTPPLTVISNPSSISITTNVTVSYYPFTSVTDGSLPYNYSIDDGTLPSGLTLNPVTGLVSGTPTVSASGTITFRVTDSAGYSSSSTVPISIRPATTAITYLAVGGGGGGGGSASPIGAYFGGGGGGGAVQPGSATLTGGATYTITVGAGGAGMLGYITGTISGTAQGGSSSFVGGVVNVNTGGGGQGGGGNGGAGIGGSSGGGAGMPATYIATLSTNAGIANQSPGVLGIAGSQGFPGGASFNYNWKYAGGGGGAGGAANTGSSNPLTPPSLLLANGAGGQGILIPAFNLFGDSRSPGYLGYFGGGGNGFVANGNLGISGVQQLPKPGGGGTPGPLGPYGTANPSSYPINGWFSTGGGGGGGGNPGAILTNPSVPTSFAYYTGINGGNGGSGTVILAIPTTSYSGIYTGTVTVVVSGATTYLQFFTSGTYLG